MDPWYHYGMSAVKLPTKKGDAWIAPRSVTAVRATGEGTCAVTAAGEVHEVTMSAAVVRALLGSGDHALVTR